MSAPDVDASFIRSLSLDSVLTRRDVIVERLTRAHKAVAEAENVARSFNNHVDFPCAFINPGTHRSLSEASTLEHAIKHVEARIWSTLFDLSGMRQHWPWEGSCELHGVIAIKGFKNGNAHITFLRPDLVDKINSILAKEHPNALPTHRE